MDAALRCRVLLVNLKAKVSCRTNFTKARKLIQNPSNGGTLRVTVLSVLQFLHFVSNYGSKEAT